LRPSRKRSPRASLPEANDRDPSTPDADRLPLRRAWTLSLSQYAGLLLGLNLILLTAFGGFTLLRVNAMDELAEQGRYRSAQREAAIAVDGVITEASYLSHRIAISDQTRAQMADASLYRFWRSDILLNPQWLPTYVEAVEIYDAQGQALDTAGPLMPNTVKGADEWAEQDSWSTAYITVAPIEPQHFQDEPPPGGFVGIRLNIVEAAQQLTSFQHLEPDSLAFVLDQGPERDPDVLAAQAQFDLHRLGGSDRSVDGMADGLAKILFVGLTLSVLIGLVLQTLIGNPIRDLEQYLQATSPRAMLRPPPRLGSNIRLRELETLGNALREYQSRLTGLHRDLDQKNVELWQLAHHDALTGARNRRAFEEDWEHVHAVLEGQRTFVACMVFDCDHFKAINDSYGHEIGDEVIRSIASTLRGALREGDHLYRIGGDEFVTLLIDVDLEEARRIGARCLTAVRMYPFNQLGIREPVRVSIGLSHTQGTDLNTLKHLRHQADMAMYHAKRPGNAKLAAYSAELETRHLTSNRYVSAVFRAIEGEDIVTLHYQPLLRADDDGPVIYEALSRLSDDQGLIQPAHVFPLVEAKGLETEFDTLVLGQLLRDLESGALPSGAGVSVNLSGVMLMSDDIVAKLAPLRSHLKRRQVMLEITETALITHLAQVSQRLDVLRGQGFTIALDDFGSGYSSLGYLARMPVDVVKFDIGMVSELVSNSRQGNIARGLANLVRDAGYQLVAEGIETADIAITARQVGFEYLQGYLLGRPLPLDQLTAAGA